jgi:hypothetical protein
MQSPRGPWQNRLHWPRPITVDLSRRSHRLMLVAALLGLLVLGLGLAVGSVQSYDYSESIGFCGTACHSMYPQYVRHQLSAHANVACAECHVGPGAQAFVSSKLDGMNQMAETVLNDYSRPIKSPVYNLRPARETCETCHSPATFKDNIVKIIRHYDNDVSNTPLVSTLILKMGGWNPSTGISTGIHWHVSSQVYYIALDAQRQDIAWVGVKQSDGSMKEYIAEDQLSMGHTAFVEQAREQGNIRQLDCIDCHNRTAHYIPDPAQAVDGAMANGLIATDLPSVRKNAVALLAATYASQGAAFAAIDQLAAAYPGQSPAEVSQAIQTLQGLYTTTNFPDMHLNWQTNPNNENHSSSLGCFRCHDDKHVYTAPDGTQETISAQCNLCHTVPITARGSETAVGTPVIVGDVPASHADFSWTISHASITDAQKQQCYTCHGQAFCNNGACHNLSHPPDMLTAHAQVVSQSGGQICYNCHQNVFCSRCHANDVISDP